MHARIVQPKRGPEIVVRPLRHGDTATVEAVFERLGEASRRARLVRFAGSAEIAFEVADGCQGRGIGSALIREVVADSRAAGVVAITALVRSDNPAAFAVLRRALGRLETRMDGPETFVRALLAGS